MRLFGWKLNKKPVNHTFDDKEREFSASIRAKNAEIRELQLEHQQKMLEMKQEMEAMKMEEEIDRLREKLGYYDDEEENLKKADPMDAMMMMIMAKAFGVPLSNQNNFAGQNVSQPSPTNEQAPSKVSLSDTQIQENLSKIPKPFMKSLKKKTDEEIIELGKSYIPNFNRLSDETIARAIHIIRES